jgi:hypothetical protein
MAQDRMLRAELRTSEKVNEWPIPVRFFWTQLWGYCDDHGRGRYDARLIKADTFPLDDEVSAEQVARWMRALEEARVIRAYSVGGKAYFECASWDEHQSIRHKKKTNIPEPSGTLPNSAKSSAEVRKSPAQGEGEREGEREREGESAKGAPPAFCPQHPSGTTDKCGPCGDARRARKAYDTAKAATPTPRATKFGQCPAVIAKGAHRYVGGYCAECSQRQEAA